MTKTFVKVTAEHKESGRVRPLSFTWTVCGEIGPIHDRLLIFRHMPVASSRN